MYGEKSRRSDRFLREPRNPSFSSTILDEIYRSIDEDEAERTKSSLHWDTKVKKLGNSGGKASHRTSAIDQAWIERKKPRDQVTVDHRSWHCSLELERKAERRDRGSSFYTSSSSSSDCSFGGFSSSEAESAPYFDSSKLRAVRTSESARPEGRGRVTEKAPFCQQRESRSKVHGDYCQNSDRRVKGSKTDEFFLDLKSRAAKIYKDLRRAKQPLSPGSRLAAFLSSLVTARNMMRKKVKSAPSSSPSTGDSREPITDREFCSPQDSNRSSASSSLSSMSPRSCLRKGSRSSKSARLDNCVKKSVTFAAVSVVIDEDCRPCGHKRLNVEGPMATDGTGLTSLRSALNDREEFRSKYLETSLRARDIFKNLHQIQSKNEPIKSEIGNMEDDDDGDYDSSSDSSSDLFELDHLALVGKGRYCDELPVYETTRLDTNRWFHC